MFNNARIDKEYRKATTSVIIGVILCLLAVFGLLMAGIKTAQAVKNADHLNSYIVSYGDDRKDRIAYLDTTGFYQVATYGDDLGYYIAYDDDFYYIISIKEKDWDYFAKQFDDQEEIRIWGYTDEIPAELKSFAIDSLNEDYPDANVTLSDFEDIFGDLMLRAARTGSVKGFGGWYNLTPWYLVLAFFGALFGFMFLLIGLNTRKSFRVLKQDEFGGNAILDEINAPDTVSFDNDSIYLTQNYLVNTKGSISPVRYEDIFWMYVTSHRTNGIHDYDYVNVVTKDGRNINCFNSPALGKKKSEATQNNHTELMNALLERNPDIRVGYVQENIEAYQELLKDLKNKKKANDIDI